MEAPSAAKAACTLGAACETGAAKAVCTPGAACAEKPSAIPRRTAIIATTKRGQHLFPADSPELMSSLSRWWYWRYFTIGMSAVLRVLLATARDSKTAPSDAQPKDELCIIFFHS